MSEPWGGPDNVCPKCGSADVNLADEGKWAECNDCGFVKYDAYTLALIAEVKREQAICKKRLGYIPTYAEARRNGWAK